ncbi:Erg28-like protein [Conidiobolus coronatus NRRL 28638]|uniref:Erg28-like protein n=1 Tax=Conidiobolus coronatus (strain ATCC 28846 / CBS 209.66 / NRRL 28638) TaxID=796925 RepID=A0A137PJD1_CONC2|nr:Erg28-like protein [Conidiobolus coronatus NRRL 28638]|eukprot:KXN75106.1 Erg28-like protein [Conidiobolus coronatus NRRL 28638]
MLSAYIPEGALPKYFLFVSTLAFFNSAQCFLSPFKFNRRIYDQQPQEVTGLAGRLFAVWTFTSGIVRAYAAYNIHDKTIYHMTFLTYVLAFFHFNTEIFYFKTARINAGTIGPMIISTLSMIWMWKSYGYYIH